MTFGDDSERAQAPDGADAASAADGAYPAPGETQRWEGRPTPWRAAVAAGLVLTLQLPLLAAAAILSWLLWRVGRGADVMVLTALAIGSSGVMPALAWRQARRQRLLVTDHRLLAVTPQRPDGEWQLPLSRIDRVERRDHGDGTATLTLFAAGLSANRLVLHGIDRPDAAVAAMAGGQPAVDHRALWPVDSLWRADPASALPWAMEPGEQLVWVGRPQAIASAREIILEFAPVAVLAVPAAALLAWALPTDGLASADTTAQLTGGFFGLLGLVFAAPMLFAALVLPLAAIWRALTSVVAVTDRRVLIAQGLRRITVRSLFAEDLRAVVTRHTRDNGRALLYLRPRRRSAWPGAEPAFHGVADAAAGEAAIDALLARPE